ncbi:hypothetical protein OIU34_26510 [Pararhizobium sp. BT-229]|uniref:hypothetical protein n=1 Tax=Pararhizobium sp. BT-229 TaxID=2986923 RepID=UPI0021F760C4|nr:hypothetical protein [Pararhizobium sp. BT-229]MCV9965435.1 hypothetical protein [Pararhizobium sp. BT-229]
MLARVEEKLGHDAYWVPIQKAELIEVPPIMLNYTGGAAARMEPYATSVSEIPSAAPAGEFYFLVDRKRDATLCCYYFMDEASEPICVEGTNLDEAAVEIKNHCRRTGWSTEPNS